MTIATTKLSATPNIHVAKIAHGLMLMTWKNPPVDDDTCFAAIKAGLDLVNPGEKVILNSSEFYGIERRTANLEMLNRFFAKYPEYEERAFISVKGGTKADSLEFDSSLENLRRSVKASIEALGSKKIDLFEPARITRDYTIEEITTSLKTLVEEGLFDYIGLSEVSADTLRRAHKIHPIAAVEIEISPISYDDDVRKVVATAKELGVNVIAYSPIGRGFLTGSFDVKSLDSSDFRTHLPRFQEEAMSQNQKLVDALTKVSSRKGVTNAQLCIAWVASLGDHVIPLPGSSKTSRTLENFASADIVLTEEEKKEVTDAIESFEVAGERYPAFMKHSLMV